MLGGVACTPHTVSGAVQLRLCLHGHVFMSAGWCLLLQVELREDLVGSCVVGDVITVLGLVKVLATGDPKPAGRSIAGSPFCLL